RIAALGERREQVIVADHHDVRGAERQDLADDARDRRFARLAGGARELLGRDETLDGRLGRHLPVAHGGEKLVRLREAPFLQGPGEIRMIGQLLDRLLVLLSSFSRSRRPSSTARRFSCVWMKWRILCRARLVTTKESQSRDGLWSGAVRISTMSPLPSGVRRGTSLPLIRAPTHRCPTSLWM